MAQTVFIANRGEVVHRVARTARDMGMRVAVGYADGDANDALLRQVDTAVRLGPAAASESYLSIPKVVAAALACGADLVHPGYGFLAESPSFARAVTDAGLRFVGPSADVLDAVGSKAACRALARSLGIPITPGYSSPDGSDAPLIRAARELGYPLLVKPAAGGGGKGIAVIWEEADLERSLAAARRVALSAFGDPALLLERYVANVRHVEVQVLRDAYGGCAIVGDRDCSTQRRHQKVIEESPALGLDSAVRHALHTAATRLADRVGYEGAGTVEFIVEPSSAYYFMEMNPRLQVEHPVTELVWRTDLVERQLRIALGEPVGPRGEAHGHAIEARVCAEDPDDDFAPSSGRLAHVRWPERVRVDTACEEGDEVSPFYDSLLAKVVVHGSDRADAVAALAAALRTTAILGVRTNLPLLRALVAYEPFVQGRMTTDHLERSIARIRPPRTASRDQLAVAAAAASTTPGSAVYLRDATHAYLVRPEETGPYRVGELRLSRLDEAHEWLVEGRTVAAAVTIGQVWVDAGEDVQVLSIDPPPADAAESAADAGGRAPMAGRVASAAAATGSRIDKGDQVVVLEAMKMEVAVVAPRSGTLRLLCRQGDVVARGQQLFEITTEGPR